MPVAVKEWVQREWITPGVDLYRQEGDFHSLSALRLSPDTRRLERVPAWSSRLALPQDFGDPCGGFLDVTYEGAERFVVLGVYDGSDLAAVYTDNWSTWSSVQTLISGKTLGGLSLRNFAHWGGKLYLLTNYLTVYRANSYGASASQLATPASVNCLAPRGDRLYAGSSTGVIYRLNDGATDMEAWLSAAATVNIRYMAAFRHYLAVISRGDDGTLYVLRVPPTGGDFYQVGYVTGPGLEPSYGSLFALAHDAVYFSPGKYPDAATTEAIDVYSFNGSQIRKVARVGGLGTSSHIGLIAWNDDLLFYEFTTSTLTFKRLHGGEFVDFSSLSVSTESPTVTLPFAASHTLIAGVWAANPANDGVFHSNYEQGRQDGYVVTPWLDMGAPGKRKLLHSLTAILDGAATDFDVIIKYRVNGATSWTTAATDDNERRVSVADLKTAFYTLQIRVDLDDDTGANQDIGIEAISALYTIAEYA